MNAVKLTLAGKKVELVASYQGVVKAKKTMSYASVEAARAGLANLVKGAEAQRAAVTVTMH